MIRYKTLYSVSSRAPGAEGRGDEPVFSTLATCSQIAHAQSEIRNAQFEKAPKLLKTSCLHQIAIQTSLQQKTFMRSLGGPLVPSRSRYVREKDIASPFVAGYDAT